MMKKKYYWLILLFGILSCNSNNTLKEEKFQFIKNYTTTITVGGVVGIKERTFEIGETFIATSIGKERITLRIAEHTDLNNDCPNSWCYQELLEVPSAFLKIVE